MARATVLYAGSDPTTGKPVTYHGLVQREADDLEWHMRRYYVWVTNGRQADPWDSGAATVTRYDASRTKHHKPSGGYGPGRAVEPVAAFDLMQTDTIVAAQPLVWQLLFAWNWCIQPGERMTRELMVARMGCTLDMYEAEWRRARTVLYCRLRGW